MTSNESVVELSFRYLESDYVRAVRAHHFARIRFKVDFILAGALLVFGVCLESFFGSLRWLAVVCIIVALLFTLLLVAAVTIVPRLVFRREPKFRDEYSLTFSTEGIHFRTLHIDSRLQWNMYSRALISAHSWLLYYGAHQFTVIPVRAFQNAEQRSALERLVVDRVPEIVRRA